MVLFKKLCKQSHVRKKHHQQLQRSRKRTCITRHGKHNFNEIRLTKSSDRLEAFYNFDETDTEELSGIAPSDIRILINEHMSFSVTNLCFKHLITVPTIELGGLTMRFSQFTLKVIRTWYASSHLGGVIMKRIRENIHFIIYQNLLVKDIDLIGKRLVLLG